MQDICRCEHEESDHYIDDRGFHRCKGRWDDYPYPTGCGCSNGYIKRTKEYEEYCMKVDIQLSWWQKIIEFIKKNIE